MGEIGLQAQRIRLPSGEIVDGFDLFVGGGHTQLAELKEKKIPVQDIARRIVEELALLEQERTITFGEALELPVSDKMTR